MKSNGWVWMRSAGTAVVVACSLALAGCATGGPGATPDAARSPSETRFDGDAVALPAAGEGEPTRLVAEALEACAAARELWQQGDIEGALATLDAAYELLIAIPDDPSLAQQKDDLRHVISRQVVDIYRSRLTSASELNSPIPIEINEHVKREIARFQGPARKAFIAAYERSGAYRPEIVRMLREAGMPEELSWLPLVESGFKNRALSRARALGMWQFISSTGSRYGLQRSQWIDERMDPTKATKAALQYLTDLHALFGDWMTALAAYNCGENRVMRTIRRQEDETFDRFWDLYNELPYETAQYVPRFLATVVIVRDPEAYGFELPEPAPPLEFETVTVSRPIRLVDLDGALGLEANTLATFNPELRRRATPGEPYTLRVPSSAVESFEERLAALPAYVPPPEVTFARYRVRHGDTLSSIARRFGTSVSAIVRANGLPSRHRIRVGQRLKVPQRSSAVGAGPPSSGYHVVRRGDSLYGLASRYGTTVDRIKRANRMKGDDLAVGQRLRIDSGSDGSRSYTVRRGDTIGRIASTHDVSVDEVLVANGLSRASKIYPGQVLRLPN